MATEWCKRIEQEAREKQEAKYLSTGGFSMRGHTCSESCNRIEQGARSKQDAKYLSTDKFDYGGKFDENMVVRLSDKIDVGSQKFRLWRKIWCEYGSETNATVRVVDQISSTVRNSSSGWEF